jgi:hypothetical protein
MLGKNRGCIRLKTWIMTVVYCGFLCRSGHVKNINLTWPVNKRNYLVISGM